MNCFPRQEDKGNWGIIITNQEDATIWCMVQIRDAYAIVHCYIVLVLVRLFVAHGTRYKYRQFFHFFWTLCYTLKSLDNSFVL